MLVRRISWCWAFIIRDLVDDALSFLSWDHFELSGCNSVGVNRKLCRMIAKKTN